MAITEIFYVLGRCLTFHLTMAAAFGDDTVIVPANVAQESVGFSLDAGNHGYTTAQSIVMLIF